MPDNQAPAIDLELEPAPSGQQTTEPTAPTIPDKYRGKSVEELIQMHQNAERRLSQQGNELGEMRRIADGILGLSKAKPQENARTTPVERRPVTVDSLLNNPEQALTQTIEQSPVAQRAEATAQRVDDLEASMARNAFESRFPSFNEDMQNPEFLEWVKKNPARQKLAAAAYQGRYDAATDLWSLWDEVKGAQAPAPKADNRAAVQAAKVVRQGATESVEPKRIYSRAKLMGLRERVADGDPAAVAQWNNLEFQQALIQAHAEGRVR